MKNLLLFLCLFTVSACVNIRKEECWYNKRSAKNTEIQAYYNEMDLCDTVRTNDTRYSTTGMNQAQQDLTGCYMKIAHKVIDTHYSKDAKNMKKSLSNLKNSTYDFMDYVFYNSNYCLKGQCGTIQSNFKHGHATNQIEIYLKILISAIDKI